MKSNAINKKNFSDKRSDLLDRVETEIKLLKRDSASSLSEAVPCLKACKKISYLKEA